MSFKIKTTNEYTGLPLPQFMSELASGMDLFACINQNITVQPGEYKLIPTGIKISIPPEYEAQIRPRSGLALKHGITLLNSPGTIDADYRGEISVILINHSKESFTVQRGMRIAQMVFAKVCRPVFETVAELDDTVRSEAGFGSTNI